jgi:hypothetical protein
MLMNLRYFLAIQKSEQIPEPGVADQKFQPCSAAEQIEGDRDGYQLPDTTRRI